MVEKLLPDNQLGETQNYPDDPSLQTQVVETVPELESQQVASADESKEPLTDPKDSVVDVKDNGLAKMPVEVFSWAQLNHKDAMHCHNCKKPVDAHPSTVVRKKGHANFSCKSCHAVVTMLYKHSDMRKVGFRDLTPEQQTDFFLKAGQIREEMGGLSWEKVKGLLQDSLTTTEVHRKTVGVRGKFLPLEVWASKGYNVDKIKEKGEKQPSDMLLVGLNHILWFSDSFTFLNERSSSLSGYSRYILRCLQVWGSVARSDPGGLLLAR